eukprot:GHVH01011065.1.p1 GENE.GHVH01011065.1~~GHVH01011065.1.p1  ORF type:complete len:287 (+),score=43.35 GHVH01011065.1:63-923(+)
MNQHARSMRRLLNGVAAPEGHAVGSDELESQDATQNSALIETLSSLILSHTPGRTLSPRSGDELQRLLTGDSGARGAFVVFEGGDRSGKSTQATCLARHLNEGGEAAKLVRFPDRSSKSGRIIDKFLKDENMSLQPRQSHALFAYNRWECIEQFIGDLRNGIHIICDRYSFSGVAYSAVCQDLSSDWTSLLEFGLLQPDVVIQPVVDGTVTASRSGFGEERYEKNDLQASVRTYFKRFHNLPWWTAVDGGRSIEEVHQDVLKIFYETKNDVIDKPLVILKIEDVNR